MSIHRQTSLTPVALLAGLLLGLPASPVAAAGPAAQGDIVITDFSPDSPDLRWYVQNDNVMGGRSQGGFDIRPGELVFAGSTNTRGGGFCSIRTRPFKLDMSQHDGIQLHVMGDGRRYIWQLQTNARYRGYEISYWAEFDTRRRRVAHRQHSFRELLPAGPGLQAGRARTRSRARSPNSACTSTTTRTDRSNCT